MTTTNGRAATIESLGLWCKECGEPLTPTQSEAWGGRCHECFGRHEQEAVFRNLAQQMIWSPNERVLPAAIQVLTDIQTRFKL